MAYNQTAWKKGDVITAAKLNNIEEGIRTVVSSVGDLTTAVDTLTTSNNEVASRLRTVQASVSSLAENITAANLTELASSIETNTTKITEAENKVTSLEQTVTAVANTNSELSGTYTDLPGKIAALESKLQYIRRLTATQVTDFTAAVFKADEDVVVSAPIEAGNITASIKGNYVVLDGVTTESGHTNVTAGSDIEMVNVVSTGTLDKATTRINAAWSINTDATLSIKDCLIGQGGYNSIEIGAGNTAPKNVLIENVDFTGTLTNNAIIIFATADNAIINIKNCTFESVSNAVRISNRTAATNVTLNFIDCDIKKTDSRPIYHGAVICQDYTSKPANTANLYSPENLTINFINTSVDGKKLTSDINIASICASNDLNQVVYVCNDYEVETVNFDGTKIYAYAIVPYAVDRYPTINIK